MSGRINELLALPDDELNRAAALVMGWTTGKKYAYEDEIYRRCPATDHNDAARVRRACEAKGRSVVWSAWGNVIKIVRSKMLNSSGSPYPQDWYLLSLSPREITAAAIVALEQAKGNPS